MPTICLFYGITVRMYYDDNKPPHFYVFYGGGAALFAIDKEQMIAGSLAPRVQKMVQEWRRHNLAILRRNWQRCQSHEPLLLMPPLE